MSANVFFSRPKLDMDAGLGKRIGQIHNFRAVKRCERTTFAESVRVCARVHACAHALSHTHAQIQLWAPGGRDPGTPAAAQHIGSVRRRCPAGLLPFPLLLPSRSPPLVSPMRNSNREVFLIQPLL